MNAGSQKKEAPVSSSDVSINGVGVRVLDDFPAIEATGVPVAVIGEVRPSSEGITIVTNGAVEPLTPPVRDEIARAFEGG